MLYEEISKEKVDALHYTNCGYVCFMGAVNSDAEQVIYALGDKFVLTDKEGYEAHKEEIEAELEKETMEYLAMRGE